ncbi:ATP-binding protein [Variovorax sp. RTB1]|uniref:ATP-binding protein n=1 Tax=Variovorax sp. RTB1 TaxID=3048631 RepID=UPI002B222B61|nr:ATP-binding protein [Variovorax sp. RTB1]MEB0114114.1 ATP-binding protein [Variovorax sp. RTB1]
MPSTGRSAQVTRRPWSLRLRLLSIIGVSLLSVWSLVAVWMLIDVRNELRSALDDRLAASARMVAGLMLQLPAGAPPGSSSQSASPLDVIARDGLACEVSLLRGEVMFQTVARTTGSPSLASAPTGYTTRSFGGKEWRTYVLEQGGIRIATADRIDVRENLLRDIALTAGIPFALALTGSLVLLWFGIGRGLRPLEQLRVALALRRPDDASALPAMSPPPELRPLVETVERLLARTHAAIDRERRFTDDAAHELRSPLTGIKTNLQVLQLASSRPEHEGLAGQALSSAESGVLRLQATLDQLLMLARLDGRPAAGEFAPADATTAVRQAVDDAQANPSVAQNIQIECPPGPITVMVPAPLLNSALRNLIDNSLRHGAGSTVFVRVECADSGTVHFLVGDQGPGLTDEECAHAVERFWRRGVGGSGLGLAIVKAIADRYGGSLSLLRGAADGLETQLIFPGHR